MRGGTLRACTELFLSQTLNFFSPTLRIKGERAVDGEGVVLTRVFPSEHLVDLDPFILFDHASIRPPAGFPMHPHKGFEGISYLLQGSFHHTDSMGQEEWVRAGGAQRFTAGRGMYHAEMPGGDGPNEGLQLWVNLPRKDKAVAPSYQFIDDKGLPLIESSGVKVRIVAGGNAPTKVVVPIRYLDIEITQPRSYDFKVPAGWSAIVYTVRGAPKVDGATLRTGHAWAMPHGGLYTVPISGPGRVIAIAGQALGDPIVRRGPFVL